jgi:hypothetical protein
MSFLFEASEKRLNKVQPAAAFGDGEQESSRSVDQ